MSYFNTRTADEIKRLEARVAELERALETARVQGAQARADRDAPVALAA